MSFFAREPASFSPLFRLLDDFDNYNRTLQPSRTQLKTFQPKFDVRELAEAYELHGELPGVDQKNVEIEFTEPQVLSIRGHVERTYTSGTPPTEDAKAAITEGDHNNHHATVEDAPEDQEKTQEQAVTTQSQATEVTKQQDPQHKFWISERSVGDFLRSFSFPVPVDQDGVTASIKNGILTIVVPKAKPQGTRKIQIQIQ